MRQLCYFCQLLGVFACVAQPVLSKWCVYHTLVLVSLCFELLKSWRSIFHWPIWLKLYQSLCPRWGLEVFNFVVISPTHRHHHMFIQQFQQQTPHRPHMGLCCLLIVTFNSLCCWSKYVLQWRVITFYFWSVLCPVDWNNKWQMDLRCAYYMTFTWICL